MSNSNRLALRQNMAILIVGLVAWWALCGCTTTSVHYVNNGIDVQVSATSLWFERDVDCDIVQGHCKETTHDTSGGPQAIEAAAVGGGAAVAKALGH